MGTWIIDPDHSVAAFSVRHMMIAHVKGQFNKITGTIKLDDNNREITSIEAKIDAASIFTGVQKRDNHLRSADFLDIEKYPEITFKSTEITGNIEQGFRITGDLTIHGVTRSVTADITFAGPVKFPFGEEIAIGLSAVLMINREDYGITWNVPIDNKGFMVDKEVSIFLDAEADFSKE